MRGVKGGSCLLFTDNFEVFFPFTVIFLLLLLIIVEKYFIIEFMILMTWIAHEFRHMSYKVFLLLFSRQHFTVYCYNFAFTFTISPIYCLLLNLVLPFTVNYLLIFPLLMSFYVDLLITVNPLTPLIYAQSIPPVMLLKNSMKKR